MSKYFVIDDQEYDVPAVIDRLGAIRRKMLIQKKLFEKMRAFVLKQRKKAGKVLGKDYYGIVEIYDFTYLDEQKIKKLVPKKILKKCYTTNEDSKRLLLKRRK